MCIVCFHRQQNMFFCVRRPVGHLIGFQYTSESDVGQCTKALGHRLPPDVRFLRVLSIQSNPPLFVSLDVMSDSPAFLRPCTMLFVGAIPFHASDFRSCTGPQSWIAANVGMSRRRRPVRVSRVKTGFRWGYNGFLLGEDCQVMEEISSKLCSCLTCIWRTVYNPTPTVIN